jgi:ketosteroid isomerase-like protein
MTPLTRRHALGSTVALCQVPTLAVAQATSPREAQARIAIETYASAWKKGDIPALLNCYHPDFTLNYFGRNALAGRHVGKAASVRALGEMRKRTDRALKSITALMVGPDHAAMLTRESMTAKGQTTDVERLYVYTVAGEQLLECWVYDQDQRQIDALVGT